MAEVSKDKGPIGRGCAEFNWFESQLMSDSMEVRFRWFGLSSDLKFKRFGCQWMCFKWFWLCVDLRFQWGGCQLIWDSSDLVVNRFEIQLSWSSIDVWFKWFWLSVDVRGKGFGVRMFWNSIELVVNWGAIQMILVVSWCEIQMIWISKVLRFK